MPRKTRKQKKHAFAHFQAMAKDISGTTIKTGKSTDVYSFSQQEIKTAHYFKNDLKKSLLLISGIVALEIILYFASMSTVWFRLFKY
jgi:hypothetical protein